MKKYDKIFNSEKRSKESLSPEEAVAAIAVITALVDSTVEDVDAESLTDILWEFEVFDEYSEDDMVEIVYRLIAIAEAEGLGPLFNTATASLSDELVLDAFAAGVIMVLNDEDLTIPTQKQPYIKKLQAALELEEEEAEEIIKEVIAALEEDDDEEYPEDEYQTVLLEDIDQQIYQSPMGNFRVPIPVTSEQGGKIQSQSGVVRFSDDFDSLLRIDYYPFSPEQIEEIESQGKESYLKSILEDKYVPQAIFANLPEASIKSSEYLKDIWHGSYYVLVDMPQGSTISKLNNNGSSARLDAYRGLLALINQDFLYVVSSQRSFLKGDTPGSIAEESENIKESILKFVDTIEFT